MTPEETEQYRHECEVREVAGLPSREKRHAYLDAVERVRGQATADNLCEDAMKLWTERKRS